MIAKITQFFIGAAKALVVLGLISIVPYLWLSSYQCRGECTGAGWALLFILPILAIGAIVALPIFLVVLGRWTRERPYQQFGGIAIVPIVIVGGLALRALLGVQALAAVKPEYVSRTIEQPVGAIDYLIWADGGRHEGDEVLLNGIARTYSKVSFYTGSDWRNSIKTVNRLAGLAECVGDSPRMQDSIDYFQTHGIFDRCVLDEPAGLIGDGVLIGGDDNDRSRVMRNNGPIIVAVAQAVRDGDIQPEFARWEHGTLPYSGEVVGTSFTTMKFVRALTGVKTDHVAELAQLTHSERLDRVGAQIGQVRLRLRPVLDFIGTAPDIVEIRDSKQFMRQSDIAKIRKIATAICTATSAVSPSASRPEKTIDCISIYNDRIRMIYHEHAHALMLPGTLSN